MASRYERNVSLTDADGIRIIKGENCVALKLIDDAIEAMTANLHRDNHNLILLKKLKIARHERALYEVAKSRNTAQFLNGR